MKYTNNRHFTHSQADCLGVLVTNLGTPEAPTKAALRPYLKQFLSDPRVVEVPRLLWWLILNGVILNIRPARSAAAYASVWTDNGSPLMDITQRQCNALRTLIEQQLGKHVKVAFAMRYGQPSVEKAIDDLIAQGVRKMVVLPLYPQYCASTTASTFDAIAADFTRRRWMPEFHFLTSYHDHPLYIEALANSVRSHWQANGKADMLVMSYHGIPKRYLLNGDPYHCQCHKTSRLLAEALSLSPDQYMTTFQSRFGREEWLTPYTDETLKALPQKGVKSVQVVCPGFSADCLETIEEIGEENREYFLHAGGERYEYIMALNDSPEHIELMLSLVAPTLKRWCVEQHIEQRAQRATAMGATV